MEYSSDDNYSAVTDPNGGYKTQASSSGGEDDENAIDVRHKNLLHPPPPINLPTKPSRITKSKLPSKVTVPKLKSCKASGKGQKCTNQPMIKALQEANNTISLLGEEMVDAVDRTRSDYQRVQDNVRDLEKFVSNQHKQAKMIVKEKDSLEDKLAQSNKKVLSLKDDNKELRDKVKALERKLKKSEAAKDKALDKLASSEDSVRKLKSDLRAAGTQKPSFMEELTRKKEMKEMELELKMKADRHKMKLKKEEEEEKIQRKQQKWSAMTGGGSSSFGDGTWNSKIHVDGGRIRGRSRSRSSSRDRKRSSGRGRSRRHRQRSYSYSRSRSRSPSDDKHRHRRRSKNSKKKSSGLSYQQQDTAAFPAVAYSNYNPQVMVPQWKFDANNKQERDFVPNLSYLYSLPHYAAASARAENSHPNSPQKPANNRSSSMDSDPKNLLSVLADAATAQSGGMYESNGQMGRL